MKKSRFGLLGCAGTNRTEQTERGGANRHKQTLTILILFFQRRKTRSGGPVFEAVLQQRRLCFVNFLISQAMARRAAAVCTELSTMAVPRGQSINQCTSKEHTPPYAAHTRLHMQLIIPFVPAVNMTLSVSLHVTDYHN